MPGIKERYESERTPPPTKYDIEHPVEPVVENKENAAPKRY